MQIPARFLGGGALALGEERASRAATATETSRAHAQATHGLWKEIGKQVMETAHVAGAETEARHPSEQGHCGSVPAANWAHAPEPRTVGALRPWTRFRVQGRGPLSALTFCDLPLTSS